MSYIRNSLKYCQDLLVIQNVYRRLQQISALIGNTVLFFVGVLLWDEVLNGGFQLC